LLRFAGQDPRGTGGGVVQARIAGPAVRLGLAVDPLPVGFPRGLLADPEGGADLGPRSGALGVKQA
jgi:hypothetical protein